MKITAFALSATALLALATLTPANAMTPFAAGHATAKASGVTRVVQKKVIVTKRNGTVTKKVVYKNKYRPGGRYKHAPHGWHQYHSRPGDWHTRGCVVVGPVWWCP